MEKLLIDSGNSGNQTQKKSPGQTIADAAVAGYDKGSAAKAAKKNGNSLLGDIPSMKKGGRVKKTGLHLLHKGEEVIPAHKVKSPKRKTSKRKRASVKV